MSKKDMMKLISDAVGPQQAIRMVSDAYNFEILSNRMSRMETEPTGIRRSEKKDLLLQALQRVVDVIGLM
jgi:hypothetical protein